MVETDTIKAAASNVAQLEAWNGGEGDIWAAEHERLDRAMESYEEAFIAASDLRSDSAVLDVGCGTGQTTRHAARVATAGTVLGVDLSSQMIAVARRLTAEEGVSHVSFEQADAQIHPFPDGGFDRVISRTGAMFFGDRVSGFTNLNRALAPGGRMTLLVWQPLSSNEWIREISTAFLAGREPRTPPADAPSPFALSDPAYVRTLLTGVGFDPPEIAGHEGRMYLGRDADDAADFVVRLTGWMMDGLDEAGKAGAVTALRNTMAAHETTDGVYLGSAVWIITATKPR